MRYPNDSSLPGLVHTLTEYAKLKCEYGAEDAAAYHIEQAVEELKGHIREVSSLKEDPFLKETEPDGLEGIRAASEGWKTPMMPADCPDYRNKLKGALYGRFAGCTLGVPVENWGIKDMRQYANYLDMAFPPENYWKQVQRPFDLHYGISPGDGYTEGGMDGVPADDDITYTIMGLLILEECGKDFTTEDVAKTWKKYLKVACTAESVALENYKKGISSLKAGENDNPYCQFIGADIRSDPWGYVCPGNPQKAAEMAYQDAYFSHRRNGIFGAMYFAAVISLAFTSNTVWDALEGGLNYIPRDCQLAKALRWALDESPRIGDFEKARAAVDERFAGMHPVHTINNACITVFGLALGGQDFTRAISNTVAMGMDNDCNAATVGSILGAVLGYDRLPAYWFDKFNNKVYSYIIGHPTFELDDLVRRFELQKDR